MGNAPNEVGKEVPNNGAIFRLVLITYQKKKCRQVRGLDLP